MDNGIKDLIKLQMMSRLHMGEPAHGGAARHGAEGGWWAAMLPLVLQALSFALICVADEASKHIPALFKWLRGRVFRRLMETDIAKQLEVKQALIADSAVPLERRHFINTVSLDRIYMADSNSSIEKYAETNAMADAVLAHISKLDNVPSFKMVGNARMMLSYRDQPIQISDTIYVQLDSIDQGANGEIGRARMTLMSNVVSAAEISRFVRYLHALHEQERRNALGDTIYYFDEKARGGGHHAGGDPRGSIPVGSGGSGEGRPSPAAVAEAARRAMMEQKRMRISAAPKQLTFTRMPFSSTKQFSNIFGDEAREVERRVKFFCNNRAWYEARGVPYQLGILLSGVPGSGKTSIIRAISNYTRRHIVNVNFANIATATQLKNLFYSETLNAYTDNQMHDVAPLTIPVDQRIFVLEEIDTVGDLVRSRKGKASAAACDVVPDELTLGEILTALDGTLECPGRIIVMTSNHPEVLDEALIRPGRIDVCVRFGYATRRQTVEMYNAFFDRAFPADLAEQLPEGVLTPAEVSQALFRQLNLAEPDPLGVIADLRRAAEQKEEKRAREAELEEASKPLPAPAEPEEEAKPAPAEARMKEPDVGACIKASQPEGAVEALKKAEETLILKKCLTGAIKMPTEAPQESTAPGQAAEAPEPRVDIDRSPMFDTSLVGGGSSLGFSYLEAQ